MLYILCNLRLVLTTTITNRFNAMITGEDNALRINEVTVETWFAVKRFSSWNRRGTEFDCHGRLGNCVGDVNRGTVLPVQ